MQPTRKFVITRSLACLIAAATLGCASSSSSPATKSAEAPGGGEPNGSGKTLDISLPNIDGEEITLASRRDTDIFVLSFWAIWCTPCQAELSKLDPVYQAMKDRGLHVYGISIDGPDTAAQVPSWARREGYTMPILLDRETEVLARFNPSGDIPFYVVLDANGTVLKTHQGYVDGDVKILEDFLDERLPK